MKLPDWLQDKLRNPPTAGNGIHGWLFSVARHLHAHMGTLEIEDTLTRATAHCGRHVPRSEITAAVRNSLAVAWTPKDDASAEHASRRTAYVMTENTRPAQRPAFDHATSAARISDMRVDGVTGVADLWERSPRDCENVTVDDWLSELFPDADWLCIAVDHPATARTRSAAKWFFGPAEACGLIVPSPMTGPSGLAKDGTKAHRCNANTGARRWLIVEFDTIAMDAQASLHWHLGREAAGMPDWPKLRIVVLSGGKSLHGWYGPCKSEESAKEFFDYAVSLGADPATWTPCQLVRLPEGVRKRKTEEHASMPDGITHDATHARQSVVWAA